MTKQSAHYLRSCEIMMNALDDAEGLSSRHLECFHFNFAQLITKMIDDARLREITERAEKLYPMGRHDA